MLSGYHLDTLMYYLPYYLTSMTLATQSFVSRGIYTEYRLYVFIRLLRLAFIGVLLLCMLQRHGSSCGTKVGVLPSRVR